MKRFLPVVILAAILALISILLFFWKRSDPSSAPVSAKPLGASTLSHGGPAPARQDLSTIEQPRADIPEQSTTR